MFTIDVKLKADAVPRIQAIWGIVADKRGLMLVMGRRASEVLKQHFARLERQYPNKMGGKRTHFWRNVRDSVQMPKMDSKGQVVISVTHPVFAHKVGIGPAGGWIKPKAKKWLAIPMIPAAYGMSPLEYQEGGKAGANGQLMFFKKSEKTAFLAEVAITFRYDTRLYDQDDDKGYSEKPIKPHGPRKDIKIVKLVYVLKKRVFQKPFADALPSPATWERSFTQEGKDFVEREIAKAAASTATSGSQNLSLPPLS